MKLREIKQHNIFSIVIIVTLILCDLISYYLSYSIVLSIKNSTSIVENPYLIIIGLLFLFRYFNRYNPSSIQSRSREIKILFNVIFVITFLYINFKILFIKINVSHLQDIILLSIVFFFITTILRLMIRTFQKQLLHWNVGLKKTVIIGANHNTFELWSQHNNHKHRYSHVKAHSQQLLLISHYMAG